MKYTFIIIFLLLNYSYTKQFNSNHESTHSFHHGYAEIPKFVQFLGLDNVRLSNFSYYFEHNNVYLIHLFDIID